MEGDKEVVTTIKVPEDHLEGIKVHMALVVLEQVLVLVHQAMQEWGVPVLDLEGLIAIKGTEHPATFRAD